MSETTESTSKPVILPYQKPIFDRLCTIARACLYVDRRSITALKLRANFLLLDPTGTGKTFLAKEVAREMQVPFLSVAVSDWIILGGNSRGSSVTWPNIVNFIKRHRNKRGAILFIDELDKCNHDSNWNSFLRSEIFSLCDARPPLGLHDLDNDDAVDANIEEVKSFLSHKTMIIGGAAIVAERSCMQNWKPECEAPEKAPDEPEVPDDPDESIAIF